MPDMNIRIEIKDKSPEDRTAAAPANKRALWAMGAQAEGHAKKGNVPVDTGLLRNSITFAVGGEPIHETHYKADKPDKSGVVKSGSYPGGSVPKGDYVAIGSSVEYAASQELGSSRGKHAHHFLRDAVANYTEEYKGTVKQSFENV